MPDLLLLLLAAGGGFLGGAMNALAGGGSFATMPTLIALGTPSTIANATSNVAVQPGAIASAWTFRDGLRPLAGLSVRFLCGISFMAGLVGSLLLVVTPTRVFDLLVPWLLLFATIAIALGKHAAEALAKHAAPGRASLVAAQTMLGVYGGYFGGGLGLMMTATWGLLAGEPPHKLMAHRTLLLAVTNAAATIVFIWAGMVRWELGVPMMVGGVAGGFAGARLGRVLPPVAIRWWTLLVTAVTTAVFFWRAYA